MSQTEHQSTVPTRTIGEAYRGCMEARWEYIRARKFGGADVSAAHHRLHDSVQEYFEAMYELLVEEASVEDIWEGCEEAYLFESSMWVVDVEDDGDVTTVPVTEIPQSEWSEQVEKAAYRVPVYAGLRELEGEFNQTEIRGRSYTDALGEHIQEEEVPRLHDPETLFRASRLLNRAAKQLGFIPEPSPPDEIDPEPI